MVRWDDELESENGHRVKGIASSRYVFLSFDGMERCGTFPWTPGQRLVRNVDVRQETHKEPNSNCEKTLMCVVSFLSVVFYPPPPTHTLKEKQKSHKKQPEWKSQNERRNSQSIDTSWSIGKRKSAPTTKGNLPRWCCPDRPTDRLRLLYQTTWRPPSSQTIVFYVKNTVDNQHQTPDTRLEYLSMFCSYRLTDQSSFKTNPVSFGRTRICGRPTSRRVSFFLFDSSWQTSFYFSLFFFCSFRVFWPSRFSTRSTLQPAYPFVPVCRRLSDDTRYAHTPPCPFLFVSWNIPFFSNIPAAFYVLPFKRENKTVRLFNITSEPSVLYVGCDVHFLRFDDSIRERVIHGVQLQPERIKAHQSAKWRWKSRGTETALIRWEKMVQPQ